MELRVTVTWKHLFDYMLYHTYTSLAGIMATAAGSMMIIGYTTTHKLIYLIAGIIVILYLPWNIFLLAKKRALTTPEYAFPITYSMEEEGIRISQQDKSDLLEWSMVTKVVSTPSSILVYTGKNNATILPKQEMGKNKEGIIRHISTHVNPDKVKIRQG